MNSTYPLPESKPRLNPSLILEVFESYYEKNATLKSVGDTDFKGVARLIDQAGVVVLILPFVIGALTIAINSVQLWTLKKKFRRELNSLFVILRHLCIADLLNGVVTLTQILLSVLEWKLFPENTVLLWLTEAMSTAGNKYMFFVSTVLLNCLTLLKMIIVTRNCWYTRATVKKICKCVWLVILIFISTEYGVSKALVISSKSKVVLRVWVPLCTSASFIFQCGCFARIYYRTRTLNNRATRAARADRRTRSDGNFLKIAIFQIISYVMCVCPISTYLALPLFSDFKVENHWFAILGVLAYLNSIIDPIVFFVVYKHKWMRPRSAPPVQEIGMVYVINGANGRNS